VSAPVILPGATIGVLGGGQLGRMTMLEARRMGYRTLVLDATPGGPGTQVADEQIVAPLDDLDAVRELARRSDVVTLEWENADLGAARAVEEVRPLRPGSAVLAMAQHRLREKDAVRRAGLDTAEYRGVRSREDLRTALAEIGTPAVLKTCEGGYDGHGQRRIERPEEADDAFAALAALEGELILEAWVPFRLEISVITARTPDGEVATFPVGENGHRDGILDTTVAPADIPDAVEREARRMGEALAETLGVEGLLAVEMFVTGDDRILVNEIAPRPHNSGHYTWEACTTSQFEQHLRAVCNLPLGSTELLRPAAMANLLGDTIGTGLGRASTVDALRVPGVALHLYGKAEGRPRRKMGHLTALADTPGEARERVQRARDAIVR
jgi:5-(carboxyamino)imidazole ribonucleotide synthase